MITDIKVALYEQKRILNEMLKLLDDQFVAIARKDIEKLNEIIPKLENTNKELATIEIKRRSICSEKEEFEEKIQSSDDENLKETYKNVKQILELVRHQYKSNEILLRKELMFTKKMINFIKPSDNMASTYNSYGYIK